MITTLLDTAAYPLTLGYGDQTPEQRWPGLHVSDIYKRLLEQADPKRFAKAITPDTEIRMELGILVERAIEREMRAKYATTRPGQIVSPEGVVMSPDGVDPIRLAGEEYKATAMSSRPLPGCLTPYTDEYGMPRDKFLHWFIQMKAYAKHLEVLTFVLAVLHLYGDYSRPFKPAIVVAEIQFTPDELEENWSMLIAFARREGMLPDGP